MSVTLYTKPGCPQCVMTEKQLERYGVEFQVVDITTDPEAAEFVTSLGYQSAPVLIADEETRWSGFRPDRIKALSAPKD